MLCQFNAISCLASSLLEILFQCCGFSSLFGGKFLSKFKEFPLELVHVHDQMEKLTFNTHFENLNILVVLKKTLAFIFLIDKCKTVNMLFVLTFGLIS